MGDGNRTDDGLYVLLTGANSGLGLSICLRLIDEFIATRSTTQSLHLNVTTRDEAKSQNTIRTLTQHLNGKSKELHAPLHQNVFFRSEQIDLTSLRSVLALSEKLKRTLPRLDVVLLNAGIGGYTGINWPFAAWTMMTDFPYAATYPTFNIAEVGTTTKRQTPLVDEEPPLGQVFCSNVFGHYMLVTSLAPLLEQAPNSRTGRKGRIIWISSLEAHASGFSADDLQGLSSDDSYKSSKRLTDLLVLTQPLPRSTHGNERVLEKPEADFGASKMYLAHPGICATSFTPLNIFLYYLTVLAFYLARWVGSQWHTVSSYKGACAPVWLTLALQEELDSIEADGAGKWGSCVDFSGNERVTRTEVEGWSLRGKMESHSPGARRRRTRGMTDLTEEQRSDFLQLGKDCWQQMRQLSRDWRQRLAVQQAQEKLESGGEERLI